MYFYGEKCGIPENVPRFLKNAFHFPEERHLGLASLCNPIFDDGLHTFYKIPINMHVHGMDIHQHTVCQLIHGMDIRQHNLWPQVDGMDIN